MGNCCGPDLKDHDDENRTQNESSHLSYNNDPTQYKAASRDEVVAAAERRLAEQKAKNEVKTLRHTTADLPGPPNSGQGGLRWQLG